MTADQELRALPLPASLLLARPPDFPVHDQNGLVLELDDSFDPHLDPIVFVKLRDLLHLITWGEEHAAAIVIDEAIPLWERQFFVQRGLMMEAGRLYNHRARFKRLGALVQILTTVAPFLVREPSTSAATLSMMPPSYQPAAHGVATGLIAASLQANTLAEGDDPKLLVAALLAGMVADLGLVDNHRDLISFERAMTPPERNILHAHPMASSRLLTRFGVNSEVVRDAVYQHHERIDGSGYPLGIGGDAISRLAQYVGLADRFTMLTVGSPRAKALERGAAIEVLSTQGFADPLLEQLAELVATPGDVRMVVGAAAA